MKFRALPVVLLVCGSLAASSGASFARRAPARAAASMSVSQDSASLLAELKKVRDDADPKLVQQLGNLRTREAMNGLIELYDSVFGSVYMRREVVKALGSLDGVAEAEQPALQKLTDIATGSTEFELRSMAIETIGTCNHLGKHFLKTIVESRADDDVRERAMQMVVAMADDSDKDFFERMFKGPSTTEKEKKPAKKDKDKNAEPEKIAASLRSLRELAFERVAKKTPIEKLYEYAREKNPNDPEAWGVRRLALLEIEARKDKGLYDLAKSVYEDNVERGVTRGEAARILAEADGAKIAARFLEDGRANPAVTPAAMSHAIADELVTFSLHTKTEMKKVGVDTTLLSLGSSFILAEKIVEIKRNYPRGGDIVWEWRIFDHITPKDSAPFHPERISGAIVPALWSGQWVHLNGLDYSPATDLIVFSSRIFSELYVIDHSTTKVQAAGSSGGNYNKGGDILYRWGKPGNYGAAGSTTIDCLHSTTWIPEGYKGAGHILFFHNNIDAEKSEVIEIDPPLDADGNFIKEAGKPFGPETPFWKYAPGSNFFSAYMSSTMRMAGAQGHTIVHESYPAAQGTASGMVPNTDSRIREVSSDGQIVDSFSLKGLKSGGSGMMMAFNPAKIMYYPSAYPGIIALLSPIKNRENGSLAGPSSPPVTIRQTAGTMVFSGVAGDNITLITPLGKTVLSVHSQSAIFTLRTNRLPTGIYCVKVTRGEKRISLSMVNVSHERI